MTLEPFFIGLDAVEARFHLKPLPRTVRGYFDNAFFDVSVGETVLDTTQPRLTCKLSDVKDIPREALVTINNTRYSVIQIQPEGTGLATILLAHE